MKTFSENQKQLLIFIAACFAIFLVVNLLNYHVNTFTDLSHQKRNSLAKESQELLHLLDDELSIRIFTDSKTEAKAAKKLLKQLQLYKKDTRLELINPTENPSLARELNYSSDNAIQLSHQEKTLSLASLSPKRIHNALQNLLKKENPWLVFTQGKGERSAFSSEKFNYAELSATLEQHEFKLIEIDPASLSNIPENADVLIIAAPTDKFEAETLNKIKRHINKGGNLLWLAETDSQALPSEISEYFGIQLLDGILVDATSQKYIQGKPDFIPVESYLEDNLFTSMKTVSLFPQVRGLHIKENTSGFTSQVVLNSSISSWTETSSIRGNIAFNENSQERAGPINIAVTFTRPIENKREQRIVFMGDADYISNAYINNGGNKDLAIRLFKWLSHQDLGINIDRISAPDTVIDMSNRYFYIISFIFIIALPVLFILTSLLTWVKKK